MQYFRSYALQQNHVSISFGNSYDYLLYVHRIFPVYMVVFCRYLVHYLSTSVCGVYLDILHIV